MYNIQVLIGFIALFTVCVVGIHFLKKACEKYANAMEADPPEGDIQTLCVTFLGTLLLLAYIACWIGSITTGAGAAIMAVLIAR